MSSRLLTTIISLLLSAITMADNSTLYDNAKLSSSLTTSVCQDRHGYIWIGTEYGLNKFDGYRFTQYLNIKNDTTSLSNNEITTLFTDSKDRLWIGQSNGLARYDYNANNFVRYTINGRNPRVGAVVENNGSLIIGTGGYGLFTLKEGATSAERLPLADHRRTDDFCSSLFVDANGDIWRGSQLHLVTRYTRGKNGVYAHKDYPLTLKGPAMEFLSDGNKGFWIICMYGIMRYDYARKTLTDAGIDLSLITNTITMRTARMDRHGNMLIGTSGGGLLILPRGGKSLIRANHSNDILLHNTNVNNILCDRQGGIWMSCYGKGIYKTGGGDNAFKSHTFSDNGITLGSRITSTAYCYGSIWCTSQYSGLYRFNSDGTGLQVMNCPQGTNLVYSARSGEQLWICTNNTIYRYYPDGTYKKETLLNGYGITTMTDDGRGRLYISDYGRGLFVYDTNTGRGKTFSMYDKPAGTKANVLHNNWIKSLYMLQDDILMIGTVEGLQAFNPSTMQFGPTYMSGTLCSAMLKVSKSHLLVGTISGLYSFNLFTSDIQPLKGAETLQDKKICAIEKDKSGNLWVSTSSGIWKKSQNDSQWHGYIRGNGLITKEYIAGTSFTMPNGNICFATADGITFFNPKAVERSDKNIADVQLSNIIIAGETQSPFHDTYTIPYDNNSFSLEYSTLTYNDVNNITFEYRINGAGKWEPFIDGHNNITFTHMPPGTYTIETRARNSNNVSSNIKTITIKVSHPWYSSPLAYIIYNILVVLTITFIFLSYRRRKKVENDEAKMQLLINATHDIRSPLTLILGPLARLKEMIEDNKQAEYLNVIERNAQKLLLLVNQILDERKIDKNQMQLHCRQCDLTPFVSNICTLYQYRADEKNIKLEIKADGTPINVWIDSIQFDKVINNLLSNAFKYTADNGEIIVNISDNDKEAVLKVIDNGIGIEGENSNKLFERFYQGQNSNKHKKQGTGIGLNLSRAIVEMHGGKITAGNREDGQHGTCFTVTLPHGHSHLKPEFIEKESNNEVAPPTEVKNKASQNVNVLVVDDNNDLTQYISNELSKYYKITTCADGLEALNTLHRSQFDLVISDVMMPRMDGIELLRNIKQTPRLSHIPIIMLTSKNEIEDRLLGLRKGADAYMAKPFNIEELQATVDNQIANSRRLKGKYSGNLHTEDNAIQTPEMKGNDEALMERVLKVINKNLGNQDFNVEMLAEEVGISRAQLHRKMKEITGITTSEYIRNIRMEHASRLIKENKVNITQVAYAVGFNNQAHFSTVFKKHLGMSPSEYASKENKN